MDFGVDSNPLAADMLPGSSVDLDWYNNNRKRLKKLARQYLAMPEQAVAELRSQGEADTTQQIVQDSRAGFSELRVRLGVLNQYYTYASDSGCLAKIKAIVLKWVRVNQPTGKPIDETNFENLLRVIGQRWNDFSPSEQQDITDWLQMLKAAKEAWSFIPLAGEGALQYGNHYTHHYKILLQLYTLLGLTTQRTTLLGQIGAFAADNFPYGGGLSYPLSYPLVGASVAEGRFDIAGNHLSRFPGGVSVTVAGNSQGNDGSYTVVGATYLSSSDKTRITVGEALAGDGGGGTLHETYTEAIHALPRAATDVGESIDYIRRDALHYHIYDLEPWLEIAIQAGGTTFLPVVDAAYAFLQARVLSPAEKHYEFAASVDPFDALRWQTSFSEYLQPQAMLIPDKIARCVWAYTYYRQGLDPAFQCDGRMLSFAYRSSQLPSVWYYYFRAVFAGMYG